MPKKSRKATSKSVLQNRKVQIMAGAVITAVVLFGLIVPVGAMQFENHDSFCASCHTEGEVTFFRRETSSPPNDLASFHAQKGAARCIDCHTGPGILGRYVGLTYGASDLVSYFSGHYPQPAVQDTPLGDGNCVKCHSAVFNNQSFNNHFHVLLPKWRAADSANAARCVDCHASHATTGNPNTAFLEERTTVPVCQKCHGFAGQG
jgi:hypothetical protein